MLEVIVLNIIIIIIIIIIISYGCEVWLLKTEQQRKLLALEMDYLRRSARVSRLQENPKHCN